METTITKIDETTVEITTPQVARKNLDQLEWERQQAVIQLENATQRLAEIEKMIADIKDLGVVTNAEFQARVVDERLVDNEISQIEETIV